MPDLVQYLIGAALFAAGFVVALTFYSSRALFYALQVQTRQHRKIRSAMAAQIARLNAENKRLLTERNAAYVPPQRTTHAEEA
jgi:hypothetical protein